MRSESNENLIWSAPLKQASVSIKIKDLSNLWISTYDVSDPDSPAYNKHGYQREPDKRRFSGIAKYYLDNPHTVPPLLISIRSKNDQEAREIAKLISEGKFTDLQKKYGKTIASVIDGQHRMHGLLTAAKKVKDFGEFKILLTLFFGLQYETEATTFNAINSTQRKLPKALIETTKGDISERGEMSHAQSIRKIAFGLARDSDSVWYDQINMTGGRAPGQKVTYEGLRRSCANMFPATLIERLHGIELDPLDDVAKPFWHAISTLSPNAWNGSTRVEIDPDTKEKTTVDIPYRLKELVGVASLSRLGQDIIASALEANQDYGVRFSEALINKMKPLTHVEWEKAEDNIWMASQAGFAGQAKLYGDLYKLVYSKIDPNGIAVL